MEITVYIKVDQWPDTMAFSMASIRSRIYSTDSGAHASNTKGHSAGPLVLSQFTDKQSRARQAPDDIIDRTKWCRPRDIPELGGIKCFYYMVGFIWLL